MLLAIGLAPHHTLGRLTRINPAPFSTFIPPGVVPIMLHTCCAFPVAHLYNAGVFSKPFVSFPENSLETLAKCTTLSVILNTLIVIRSLPNCNQVFLEPLLVNKKKKIGSYF